MPRLRAPAEIRGGLGTQFIREARRRGPRALIRAPMDRLCRGPQSDRPVKTAAEGNFRVRRMRAQSQRGSWDPIGLHWPLGLLRRALHHIGIGGSGPVQPATLFDGLEADVAKQPKRAKKAAQGGASVDAAEDDAPVEAEPAPRKRAKGGEAPSKPGRTAQEMAERQREISVAEFFTKNRHLLGFDSPLKALLTAVKEAVDNSLDACEEAGILPEITVEIVADGREPLPHGGRGQRAGHRRRPDRQGLRQAALRLEVPQALAEPRPAGHRHLGGRHVRPAHDRQARADPLAHRQARRRRTSSCSRSTRRKNRPDIHDSQGHRLGRGARHARRDRDGGALPEGPALGRHVPEADGDRQPAPDAALRRPGRREGHLRAQRQGAPARRRSRSSRTRTGSSSGG